MDCIKLFMSEIISAKETEPSGDDLIRLAREAYRKMQRRYFESKGDDEIEKVIRAMKKVKLVLDDPERYRKKGRKILKKISR